MERPRLVLQGKQPSKSTRPKSDEKAIMLLEKAADLRKQGQLDQALRTLNQAAFLKPDFHEIYALRGQIYQQTGQYTKGLTEFNQAIELKPDNTAYYIQRGELYRILKQPENALNNLNQALLLEPESTLALGRRGIIYRNTRDFVLALADYNKAIQLEPENPWLYGNRAETYRSLHEYRKAVSDYTQVLMLNSEQTWVYERRGYTYLWLGYLDSARSDYEQNCEVNSKNILSGWLAEWIRMCKNDFSFSTALESRLKKLAAIAPKNYGAFLSQGGLNWLHNAYKESYNKFNTACEQEPSKPEAYFWKGMAAAALKKNDEAIDLMQTALELRLPPVLLSPANWLKTLNPAFFMKFDQRFLSKNG